MPPVALRGAVMRRGPQGGSANRHAPQHTQGTCNPQLSPPAQGQLRAASRERLDPSAITAAGKTEGPPHSHRPGPRSCPLAPTSPPLLEPVWGGLCLRAGFQAGGLRVQLEEEIRSQG